jgi:imidazole glycerol-phosphate synthase subunit HisH
MSAPCASRPVIGLIRYGAGNTGAVRTCLADLGATVREVVDSEALAAPGLDGLVLPGVGAMASAADEMRARDLWDSVRERALGGMPLLGVCLGMQLLFGPSEEGGEGLALLEGRSARLSRRRVPHLGWAQVVPRPGASLFAAWQAPAYAYFAHSYAVVDLPDGCIAATTAADEDGDGVVAAVAADPVYGLQFHPERSQGAGRAVLEAFLARAAAS